MAQAALSTSGATRSMGMRPASAMISERRVPSTHSSTRKGGTPGWQLKSRTCMTPGWRSVMATSAPRQNASQGVVGGHSLTAKRPEKRS